MRCELEVRIQEALNSMDEIDREVLVMRQFEQLSNVEAAEVLGLSQQAASKRYIVALRRLKETLGSMPGFLDEANGARSPEHGFFFQAEDGIRDRSRHSC